ncbi:hypothetical protein GBAR_LOCUS26524, partial [Geodia barretti]
MRDGSPMIGLVKPQVEEVTHYGDISESASQTSLVEQPSEKEVLLQQLGRKREEMDKAQNELKESQV